MEIGDTIEEERETEEGSERSSRAGPRRKDGKNGGKGRNGKGNGNGAGSKRDESDAGAYAPDGKPAVGDLRRLLNAMRDLRDGEFDVRLPMSDDPLIAEIADAFNGIAKLNERLSEEMLRVSTTIGRQGQMNDRASVGPVTGGWRSTVESVNTLITDLASPTTEVARVLTAVAEGDLSQKMVLEIDGKAVQGEFLRIGTTVNTMVDQLGSFANEVTRVAREVGTEGKLGDLLREISLGDGRGHRGNVSNLAGEISGERVDVVRQILPGAGDSWHFGLST